MFFQTLWSKSEWLRATSWLIFTDPAPIPHGSRLRVCPNKPAGLLAAPPAKRGQAPRKTGSQSSFFRGSRIPSGTGLSETMELWV